ncbi:hypothetical protein CBL_00612 [Carabus blaptoides fortunei]
MISSIVKFVAVVLCINGVFGIDEYITEVQENCKARSDFYACGKYEFAKYISKKVTGNPTKVINGVMEFITVEQPETTANLFPATRQMSGDSEFKKFVKFLQRQTDAFLGSRALSISLPDSAKIVNPDEPNNELVESKVESRGRKKKKAALLIPLIILFKLFKVKVLVAAVLFGVLFIKKALILLFIVAPSYLQTLKICKTQQHPHAHVEEHDFGGTGYGYGHTAHAHHGGYAKEWGNSRAYSAHRPM